MAALLLVLVVIDAVVVGDALLANTGASTVSLFNYSITGFTHGQQLVMAAALGLLGGLLMVAAWTWSGARRAKRREQQATRRDLEGRVAELERENTHLRQRLERTGRVETHR
ncbi:MAG TPA: hypothetical protein VE776_11570 [Actinomycetota bacterium]|jgi:membrane protein implicated in regulation of membrane protease activity|nr:hypothetical protein [Actinomycetota bacterium]